MNALETALAARAFRTGCALRTANYRHRRLVEEPLAVVLWQLGTEIFAAAAIGWGPRADAMEMAVAGEPRNPDLALAALMRFARWFNPRFEAHAADRETLTRGKHTWTRARTAPQVLVANNGTVGMLGNLGRRLAYLPTSGPRAVPEALVRLGRHLRFLWDHWAVPGQQMIVSLTDLLGSHWATPQSQVERQSLAALDAYIEPPFGEHGFHAAARAEQRPVGPVPDGENDQNLLPLVETFNAQRAGSTRPEVVGPLLGPIEAHYRRLIEGTWGLLWRCRDREAAFLEAPSVGRRWDEDRDAYTRHMDWMAQGGLRRTRQTPRQAALTLQRMEEAQRLLEAEEACDDPLRMVPSLLEHKAVRGRVVAIDLEYRELEGRHCASGGPKRMMRRPLVTLLSEDACLMPAGKELWWTREPAGRTFVVHEVRPAPRKGSLVTLKLVARDFRGLPVRGTEACFSVHRTGRGYITQLPTTDPWTHQTPQPRAVETIEDEARKG